MSIEVKRPSMDLGEEREHENLLAGHEANRGLIDYVAMMADVDLPDDETEEAGDE